MTILKNKKGSVVEVVMIAPLIVGLVVYLGLTLANLQKRNKTNEIGNNCKNLISISSNQEEALEKVGQYFDTFEGDRPSITISKVYRSETETDVSELVGDFQNGDIIYYEITYKGNKQTNIAKIMKKSAS